MQMWAVLSPQSLRAEEPGWRNGSHRKVMLSAPSSPSWNLETLPRELSVGAFHAGQLRQIPDLPFPDLVSHPAGTTENCAKADSAPQERTG